MAAPTEKQFSDLISAQRETTRQLMSAEERAAADAAESRQTAGGATEESTKNANRVAGGIKAASTRKDNADAAASSAGEDQSEENSSLLSKIGKGFTSFLSFSKGSASADKEKDNKEEGDGNKERGLLGKIAGGIGGLAKSVYEGGKEKTKKGFGGFMSMLKKFAIGGLMTALLLFMNSEYWVKTKKFLMDELIPKLEILWNDYIKPLGPIFEKYFIATWAHIKELFSGLGEAFALFSEGKWWEGIEVFFSSIGTFLGDQIDSIATTIYNMISSVFGSGEKTDSVFGSISRFFTRLYDAVVFRISQTWNKITDTIKDVFQGIKDWFGKMFDFGTVESTMASIINVLTFFPNMIKDVVASAVSWLLGLFGFDDAAKTAANATNWSIGSLIMDVVTSIIAWFSKIFKWASEGVAKGWTNLTSYVTGIWTSIKDWFVGIFSWASEGIAKGWTNLTGYVTGIWTSIKDWFVGVFSWNETVEKGDSWIVKTIKGVIKMAKDWVSSLFVFDGSLISLAGTAINVLTFFPNMVMKGILAASKWLLGLFGFDNAAEKLANPEDFSIGGLIMKAVKTIIDWFKNLLDFDFKSLLAKIPGASTVMKLLGGDEGEFYNPETFGDSIINRKNVGNASDAELKEIIKDDDLSEGDMAFVKQALAERESAISGDIGGGGITNEQKELNKILNARLQRAQKRKDKRDEVAERLFKKTFDETKTKRISGRSKTTPISDKINQIAMRELAAEQRERILSRGETEDNAIMRKAKLDMEMGRNRGSSANNNVDASQKIVNANKTSFTSVAQPLENKSMAGMTAGGF